MTDAPLPDARRVSFGSTADDVVDGEEVVAPPLTAVTSFGSHSGKDEPTWLANASAHVDSTASLARTISSDSHHNHQEEEDEIVVTTPRSRLGSGASVEEPAWLTDAAKRASSHVVLDLGSVATEASSPTTLEFGWETFTPTRRTTPNVERAMATSRRALDELRGLSTDELCDALLSLSHSCAQGVRGRWVAGVAETTRMARVLASAATANPLPAGTETRLQALQHGVRQARWRGDDGLLQLPMAVIFALLAVMHTVLAMLVRVTVHTPTAVRQLASHLARQAGRRPSLQQGDAESDVEQMEAGREEEQEDGGATNPAGDGEQAMQQEAMPSGLQPGQRHGADL